MFQGAMVEKMCEWVNTTTVSKLLEQYGNCLGSINSGMTFHNYGFASSPYYHTCRDTATYLRGISVTILPSSMLDGLRELTWCIHYSHSNLLFCLVAYYSPTFSSAPTHSGIPYMINYITFVKTWA